MPPPSRSSGSSSRSGKPGPGRTRRPQRVRLSRPESAATIAGMSPVHPSSDARPGRSLGDIILLGLLVFIPAALGSHYLHAPPLLTFGLSAFAVMPLAAWMGRATEALAGHVGEGVGGLLNATFGNAAEMILAIVALKAGLTTVVKASIAGSIIGNALLVLGASILAGGIKHPVQKFNRTAAGTSATLLFLSAVGLLVPAVFDFVTDHHALEAERTLSLEISVVLFATYILSLVFSLITHRHYYGGSHEGEEAVHWSVRKSLIILTVATAGIAWISEALVESVEGAGHALGFSEIFVGVIVVAVVGNAAEHSTAILLALKNRMDGALQIAIGSSIQVALFVAPMLVFISYLFGTPLDLLFTPFEVVSVAVSAIVVALVAMDGESNWLEGIQLLAVYVILAMAFYFLPH